MRVAWSRGLPSVPSSVTIVKTADDRYFASFVVEVGDETLPAAVDEHGEDIETGLDLGLTSFAVDEKGRVIDNPRFLRRAERKLKRLQRAVSRKQRAATTATRPDIDWHVSTSRSPTPGRIGCTRQPPS